jgi:hypothetical protein
MERNDLCVDCKLSKNGVCDYEVMKAQIEDALGLDSTSRQELLEQAAETAERRGCPRIAGISSESVGKS